MRVKLADFSFERTESKGNLACVRGYGRVFTVIRAGWREGGGPKKEREVKGGIVAAAEVKGGEGWRGKRGRCSHTKKLKGNPTAIGSALRNASSFVGIRISRSNIPMYTYMRRLNIVIKRREKLICMILNVFELRKNVCVCV